MGNLAKLFILICGLIFFITVVFLLIKRKISERNSLLWLSGALAILILAVVPDFLDEVSLLLGIKYPPSFLFLISTLVLLYMSLTQSMQISRLTDQLKELTQRYAISQLKESLNNDKLQLNETEDTQKVGEDARI